MNDITDNATLAHLLKYDTILGRLPYDVSSTDEDIVVDGKAIKGLAVRDPAELPWKDLGVDVVDRVHRAVHQAGGRGQAPRRGGPRRWSSRPRPPARTSPS